MTIFHLSVLLPSSPHDPLSRLRYVHLESRITEVACGFNCSLETWQQGVASGRRCENRASCLTPYLTSSCRIFRAGLKHQMRSTDDSHCPTGSDRGQTPPFSSRVKGVQQRHPPRHQKGGSKWESLPFDASKKSRPRRSPQRARKGNLPERRLTTQMAAVPHDQTQQ